ncbi:MAG TPA: NAD(P)/FAD-dependent oxidoreductase, partial [Anaerolineales bacterium]|nr:NAD(P)/FAD-dependent oxidoreductase [Anaerolineales bacterium]
WQELGAVQGRGMVDHDEFMRVADMDGRVLIAYSDPDRLEAHLKELSPADAGLIEDFAEGVRQFTSFDMSALQAKPKSLMGAEDWRTFGMKMMPFVGPLAKWGLVSAQDFANRFEDPFLQRAIPHMFAWPEIPMMAGLSLLAYMHTKNAGFPVGGSLEFARAIERRYLELGGVIHYKSQVEKILTEDNRAVGVRLYNDEIHQGQVVISSADGRGTIFDMLGGEHANRKIRRLYDGHMPIHSQIQVSLGVQRDFSGEPHWVTYLLDEPLIIAGEEHYEIGVKHYCFDPSLAPVGKSALVIMLRSNYAFWQRIYGRRLYDTEQLQVADIVLAFLEKLYPGLQGEVEVEDVATPLSYERYTGNWLGSTCGWLLTKDTMKLMIQGMDKTLPGLHDFYLAGQWVEPGGSVPLAAMSGRNVIQMICAADGRPFVTATP